MRISVQQDLLAQALSIVGRAVAPRSTLPVLGNVLLSAEGSQLRLAGTSLDLSVTNWIEAQVAEPGAVTVPARLLVELVGSLPKQSVEITLNPRNQTLNVKCGQYEANLRGIPADEFPDIPTVDGQVSTVDPATLHEAIGQVAFAAATDDTRPALAGVLMSFRAQTLTLAAADGFRLAVRSVECPGSLQDGMDIIVPARHLQELSRVLTDQEDQVQVSVTPQRNHILFTLKSYQVVSRLIEASFPNPQQIIPASHTTRAIIPTKEFANATRIASFFARDSNNIVKLQVEPGEGGGSGRLLVQANAADVGDTVGGMDATVEGERVLIAFNSKYLSDVLAVLSTAQVILEMTTPQKPGVIRPVGETDYTHVIMPMHITR